MKDRKVKWVLSGGGESVGEGRVKEGEYGQCILYTCVKTEHWNSSRKQWGRWGRIMEKMNLIRIHCICKCHNETPVPLIYANKSVKRE
jgi:hypothetical protein